MRRYDIEDDDRGGGIFWGITLILVGVVLLLQFSGRLPWFAWATGWPVIMMVLGAAKLVTSRSAKALGGAVTLILVGGWFLVAIHGWYGLDWHRSWPLAFVAIGFGQLVRAVAGRFMPDRVRIVVEDRDEQS